MSYERRREDEEQSMNARNYDWRWRGREATKRSMSGKRQRRGREATTRAANREWRQDEDGRRWRGSANGDETTKGDDYEGGELTTEGRARRRRRRDDDEGGFRRRDQRARLPFLLP